MNIQFKAQDFFVDQKTWRALHLFWLGYTIFIFFYSVTADVTVNFVIVQLFQTMGLGLMGVGAFQLIQLKFDSAYIGLLFRFYMVWLVLVVVRGATTDYELIKKLLYDGWFGVFKYAAPLLLLMPRNLYFYKKLFEVIVIAGVLCVLLYLINIEPLLSKNLLDPRGKDILETVSRSLGVSAGFIIMTYMYQSRTKKILAWIITLITIFFAIKIARRGLIIMCLAPMIVAYIVYLYEAKVKSFVIVGSVLLAVGVVDYGLNVYMKSDTFRYLQQRGLEDTRSGVEIMYYRDMDVIDWTIGKGMNGGYYCPGIDMGYSSGYRTVIETDFLQIILKGGLISLGLFFLIALPAIYQGFFQSKNVLSKAAAAWILLALINMYPSTVNTFTLNYLMVWIAIGICYSPVIRNMPEEVVKNYFQSNGKSI